MKYHKQLITHDPKNNKWGDCYRTCIACLLDKEEIEEVPHFGDGGSNSEEFYKAVDDYLSTQHLKRIVVAFNVGVHGLNF